MKKLTVLAFLAALGLLIAGCGEEGASYGGGKTKTDGTTLTDLEISTLPDEGGFTHSTGFIDPETGEVVKKIGDIKASATGATPPTAPTIVVAGTTSGAPAVLVP
ncbi:hypothetical protein AGMMS50229_06470 [Campylobacterota bacterium]|nr:hypothetical protein AGMMS50229_06470 [Campylobacterota bacterium]